MFRKFDTTKMENDIKVRQVYQKYKTLNELTRKLYAEIGEKVKKEATNTKPNAHSLNLKKLIPKALSRTIKPSVKEQVLLFYEKIKFN